jgi:hypothetical protein
MIWMGRIEGVPQFDKRKEATKVESQRSPKAQGAAELAGKEEHRVSSKE